MKRKNFVIIAVLLLTFCYRDSNAVLDQQHIPAMDAFTQFNEGIVAQTFTVGITGRLNAIEVFVSQGNPAGNLIVEIQSGVVLGDVVTPSSVLASISVPVDSLPSYSPGGTGSAFVPINLPGSGLSVSQGDELAIVMHKDSGGTGGGGSGGIAWDGSSPQAQPEYSAGLALGFQPAGWVIGPDGPEYWHPDRWVASSSLADFGFRTYVVPEPASLLLFGLGIVLARKKLAR